MPAGLDRPIVSPLLVGREACLDALGEALDQVRGGHGQTVWISGEAGVGKTRLLSAVWERATARGFVRMVQGACFERDQSIPYAPFADAARTLVDGLDPVRAVERIGPDVAGLLPELGLIPADDDPQQMRRRVIEGLIALLKEFAGRGPILCVVEDLHWSDASSLEAFAIIARRLREQPVLLVGTFRDDEVPPALLALLSELDRARLTSEVHLPPLDRQQLDHMLRAIFGSQRPPRATLADQIFELTDGNPFFVEELLRSVVAARGAQPAVEWDRLIVDDLKLPRTIAEAVRRRTRALGEVARQVVVLAATMGRRFELPLLESLTELDPTTLQQAIHELLDSQLVVEHSTDHFAFRHALTRQAIQAQILGRERRAVHQRLAAALEERYGEERSEALAYHFFAAANWPKAAVYAERAGDRACQFHATPAAVDQFSTAIVAVQRAGSIVPASLLRKRAHVLETSGSFQEALADHTAALERAVADGDKVAQCQGLLDLGFLWAARDYATTGDYFQAALTIARDLGDPATLVAALNRVGNWYTNAERPAQATKYHAEALALAEALGDRAAVAQSLDVLALATSMLARLPEALGLFDRAIALHRDLDDQQALTTSLSIRSLASGGGTPWTVARCEPRALLEQLSRAEEALRVAQSIRFRAGECFAAHCLAEAAAGRASYTRALEAAYAGLEVAEEIDHRQWACALNFIIGAVLRDVGALEEARAYAERAFEQAGAIGSLIWKHSAAAELVELGVRQGQLQAAQQLADSLPTVDSSSATLSLRMLQLARAHLSLRRGDAKAATTLLNLLLADGATPTLDLLHAEVLLAQQEPAEAERILRRAIVWSESHAQKAIAWRLRALLVRVVVAQGRSVDAQTERAAAGGLIDQISADVPARLRVEFLRMAQQATGLSTRRAIVDENGLSPREREVTELLAEGLSNRAIAERLILGERTVETHVSAILAKLGLSSRAQVAARLSRPRP